MENNATKILKNVIAKKPEAIMSKVNDAMRQKIGTKIASMKVEFAKKLFTK